MNVHYTTGGDVLYGAGTFNTDILLVGNVDLSLGRNGINHVQEVVLNSETNSIYMTGSTNCVYLFGGAGNDTLTTGCGGYLIGEGGTNTLNGGRGTNVFFAELRRHRHHFASETMSIRSADFMTASCELEVGRGQCTDESIEGDRIAAGQGRGDDIRPVHDGDREVGHRMQALACERRQVDLVVGS